MVLNFALVLNALRLVKMGPPQGCKTEGLFPSGRAGDGLFLQGKKRAALWGGRLNSQRSHLAISSFGTFHLCFKLIVVSAGTAGEFTVSVIKL